MLPYRFERSQKHADISVLIAYCTWLSPATIWPPINSLMKTGEYDSIAGARCYHELVPGKSALHRLNMRSTRAGEAFVHVEGMVGLWSNAFIHEKTSQQGDVCLAFHNDSSSSIHHENEDINPLHLRSKAFHQPATQQSTAINSAEDRAQLIHYRNSFFNINSATTSNSTSLPNTPISSSICASRRPLLLSS
jgi:hypothetical protein